MVQEGKFSKALFQELKSTVVSMPSLLTLPEDELYALTEGFTQQALMSDALQHVLVLTDKEKDLFAYDRPVSLQELKARVQQILVKKSKKSQIYQEISFDPAYDITDPDLVEAARLGKKALQEPRVMALLWNKFKIKIKSHFSWVLIVLLLIVAVKNIICYSTVLFARFVCFDKLNTNGYKVYLTTLSTKILIRSP